MTTKSVRTGEKKIKNQKKKLEKVETVERQGKKSEKEHFRFMIHQKKRKLSKQEDRLKKLEQKKESICLGSKKLFGKQHQLKENGYKSHQEWLTDFRGQRTNRIFFLGSKDETFGCVAVLICGMLLIKKRSCQLMTRSLFLLIVLAA